MKNKVKYAIPVKTDNVKLKMIFDEILELRNELNYLKKEYYLDKGKKEIKELENELNCKKERLFYIDKSDFYQEMFDKKDKFNGIR